MFDVFIHAYLEHYFAGPTQHVIIDAGFINSFVASFTAVFINKLSLTLLLLRYVALHSLSEV